MVRHLPRGGSTHSKLLTFRGVLANELWPIIREMGLDRNANKDTHRLYLPGSVVYDELCDKRWLVVAYVVLI